MELEWWVSVGWFTVINIMTLSVCACVCASVFLCLGDYQWLGVWCVWLGDCFWVSLCVCLSVYVFVIMCVYIYSFPTSVCDKCVILRCLTKTSFCALCMCVDMFLCFSCWSGVTFSSCHCLFVFVYRSCFLSLYVSAGQKKNLPPILTYAQKNERFVEYECNLAWGYAVYDLMPCVDVFSCGRGLCVCVQRRSGECRNQQGGKWSTVWGSPAEGLWD